MTKYRRNRYEHFCVLDFMLALLVVIGFIGLIICTVLYFGSILISILVNAIVYIIGVL